LDDKLKVNSERKILGVINSNELEIKNGLISYEILTEDGKKTQIYENEIEIFKGDYTSLIDLKEHFDPPRNFFLKYWAHKFLSYYSSYQIKCITNSRLTLMPHQINVAHRLSEEYFPRILLSDEVGLGKTIEAGIYLKEMQARNLADRILIIVPATLVNQWNFEMENKFNLKFKVYDGKKIKKLKKHGDHRFIKVLKNPFYYDNLILCSLQFARNPKYADLLSQISWDIVVFDEAHHLRRYLLNSSTGNYRETLNYELARKISYNCESMLLLTATPLQLHSFELYSLIELIQPDAFDNFSDFEHFRKNMPFINLMINNINNIENLNTFELKSTLKLIKNLNYIKVNESKGEILQKLKVDLYKNDLISKIENDHTLSKFLIRNRKKNVFSEEFLNERVVRTIVIKPTKAELEIYNEIRLYLAKIYNSSISNQKNIGLGFIITTLQKLLTSSKYAIMESIKRRLEQIQKLKKITMASEMRLIQNDDPDYYQIELEEHTIENGESTSKLEEIENNNKTLKSEELTSLLNHEKILREFFQKLHQIPYDSKSKKLLDLIEELYNNNPKEKIIIFTQFIDTLMFLKNKIRSKYQDLYIDTFFGGKNKKEKAETVEQFKNSKKFSILLSTEIGGEGRNFQFCKIMINYDLPWNPMKLEQRIGRLDRIGQESKRIYIYNLFLEGTIETDIIFALNKRINLFEQSIGNLEPILGTVEKNFKDLVFIEESKKQQKLREFNRNLDLEVKKAKEIEMNLDDLLIDKKSFQYEGLISNLSCNDVKLSNSELFHFMKDFFNLDNHKYGSFKKKEYNESKKNKYQEREVIINPSGELQQTIKRNFKEKYHGTFDLDIAREKEEINFFALGHPIINSVLEFCRSSRFSGDFTRLTLKKEELQKICDPQDVKSLKNLYLLTFSIEFQGFINEKRVVALFLNEKGKIYHKLDEDLFRIENIEKYFKVSNLSEEMSNLSAEKIEKVKSKAVEFLRKKNIEWKRNVKELNNHIYRKEQQKKEKIYSYTRNVINQKIQSQKEKLKKKTLELPTERQMEKIRNLTDENQKMKKLEKVKKLKEDIYFFNSDLSILHKRLDDLAFKHEDLINSMKKRNKQEFFNNLIGVAEVLLIE
jgi:SNF2 family DNA or RNA helicase